jgi:hypothetical protein
MQLILKRKRQTVTQRNAGLLAMVKRRTIITTDNRVTDYCSKHVLLALPYLSGEKRCTIIPTDNRLIGYCSNTLFCLLLTYQVNK